MPEQAKLGELVNLVLARTEDRELNWTETPQENVFSVVIDGGKHILKLYNFSDHLADNKPSLSIFSSDNKLLVDITGSTLGPAGHSKLRQIYSIAKGQASGADAAVDDIIAALSSSPEPIIKDEDIPF